MNKKLLLGFGLIFTSSLFAQTFTDNFDSYTAGQKLCPQSAGAWTTWSNAPGGNEDVLVSNAASSSPSNSLYFASTTQAGGPTDLVRHFGVLNTGQFSMDFNLKIDAGKAAYFNLQKTATMGQTYALDAFFSDAGTLTFNQVAGFSAAFPQGTWFNFKMNINFNINKWEIFINNVSVGYFANTVNQIESIDIFPVDATSPYNAAFYLDDFHTVTTPYTLPVKNAGVTFAGFNGGNIATNTVVPTFKVRNLGTSAITSFDITLNYNGNNISQSYSGLNMASLAEQSFTLTTPLNLVAGSNVLSYTVSNVNGQGADNDATDNVASITVNPIVPATGKMVVGEEATGTWCQWCPRGTVFMDKFENDFADFWAGIAVHNGDPMTVATYDTGIGTLIGGYPSSLVDRGADVDPSGMANDFYTRLQVAPTALIENGATWDPATRMLYVSVASTFQAAANNNYKIACVLTEDDVTGTGSGWSQSNAYAGGNNGVMGGFEALPNPVPAAQMVYNHVARAIQPSFEGFANSFPATVNAGDVHIVNFLFILPAGWDESKIHIISMLIDPTGKIDNAGKATIAKAITNGYDYGVAAGVAEVSAQLDDVVKIYPNPTNSNAVLEVNLKEQASVNVRISNAAGQELVSRNYGSMNGSSTINLATSSYLPGIYFVELTINDQLVVKRLIVE